jgi:hypothetical protein
LHFDNLLLQARNNGDEVQDMKKNKEEQIYGRQNRDHEKIVTIQSILGHIPSWLLQPSDETLKRYPTNKEIMKIIEKLSLASNTVISVGKEISQEEIKSTKEDLQPIAVYSHTKRMS